MSDDREQKPTRDRFHVWQPVAVRWGDMDAYQHVNNAAFFTYCESARIRYFEATGVLEAASLAGEGPVVVSATCDFLRQVRYPAELEVGVRAARMGRSSFVLQYGVYPLGEAQPVADGSSVVVWVDFAAGESRPVPRALVTRIRQLDGVEDAPHEDR